MEEAYNCASLRIDAGEVRALSEMAPLASQGEVLDAVEPTMLSGDDVLDMVRQVAVFLPQQAVLSTVVRTPPDNVPHAGIHRY